MNPPPPARILIITGSSTAMFRQGMPTWALGWIDKLARRYDPTKVFLNLWAGVEGISQWAFDTLWTRHTIYGYVPNGMIVRHGAGAQAWIETGPWTAAPCTQGSAIMRERIDTMMFEHAVQRDSQARVLMLRDGREYDFDRAHMRYLAQRIAGMNNAGRAVRAVTHTYG